MYLVKMTAEEIKAANRGQWLNIRPIMDQKVYMKNVHNKWSEWKYNEQMNTSIQLVWCASDHN